MDDKQLKMYNALKDMGAEELLDTILDYHGTQLLDDGFMSHLIDEGIVEEA